MMDGHIHPFWVGQRPGGAAKTRAWHEEFLAVVRLPDAAAQRRCEATLGLTGL
jgi:hypothetical protein